MHQQLKDSIREKINSELKDVKLSFTSSIRDFRKALTILLSCLDSHSDKEYVIQFLEQKNRLQIKRIMSSFSTGDLNFELLSRMKFLHEQRSILRNWINHEDTIKQNIELGEKAAEHNDSSENIEMGTALDMLNEEDTDDFIEKKKSA